MPTLAQPTIVSKVLRTMKSASAAHKARMAPPERHSGCTQERPNSAMRERNGRRRVRSNSVSLYRPPTRLAAAGVNTR